MIWFLLLLGVGAWLWWRRSQSSLPDVPTEIGLEPPPLSSTSPTIIAEVKCITVTPQRQEWRSLKTGRRYDVLSANGIAGAQKGDMGLVIKAGSGWRVIPQDDLFQDE